MSIHRVEKQRRAVSVVETALLGMGISGRSVCVSGGSEDCGYGNRHTAAAVFVSAPIGSNVEPCYETGRTIAEAVRNLIDSLKGRANGAKTETSGIAPF